MVGRTRPVAAFRPDPSPAAARTASRQQALALLIGLLLVAGVVTVASFTVRPSKARAFSLFYGSVFLNDERGPVSVDLAHATPTVRLLDANSQVGASNAADLAVVPLTDSTLLLNSATGAFNLVDSTGFVVKTTGAGVALPAQTAATSAEGVAAGDSAYIVQSGRAGCSIYLVDEPTVQSAQNVGAKVKPRAFATMPEPIAAGPAAAVSANGGLWVLAGSGATRTVRQLTVPAGSDPGVTLTRTDHGSVAGPAALGQASTTLDGSGPEAVAVATASQIRVFGPDGSSNTTALSGLGAVQQILPATNQAGRLTFLFQTPAGWSVASVAADGAGLDGPTLLTAIPAGARLAEPALSDGQLYTVDNGRAGQLWQIAGGTARPLAGAEQYPLSVNAKGQAQEKAVTDAYVLAKGARVIFDSPDHVYALGVFADGSQAPTRIDKSAAVDLNSQGGAAEITQQHAASDPKRPTTENPPAKAPRQQSSPINTAVACQSSHQVPHIPTITQATPGSRSATLQWSYPLLDPQDCEPSTYVVTVKVLSSQAPKAPGSATVQAQTGVTLTGLFPSTEYQVTVTAYINGTGTPSQPVDITTGPEGPAAPTNVQVGAAAGAGWTINWNSCGGVSNGCVPSADWTVIPSFCDGTGLANPPAEFNVAGDPSTHSFSGQLPVNPAWLGRGLSFRVQGVGTAGTIGTPSAPSACVYSWATPIASAMSVSASAPPPTSLGGLSSTTVTLNLGPDPVSATGGVGASYVFTLLTSSGSVAATRSSHSPSVTFANAIAAGARYQAEVVVSPPRHPEVQVIVGPTPVGVASADWPTLSAQVSYADAGATQGTLSISLSGLSSAAAHGETFDFGGNLTCGSTQLPLTRTDIDPGQPLSYPIDRTQYNGSCSVSTLTLAQHSTTVTDPPLFGGATTIAPSPPTLTIPAPDLGSPAFTAAWDGTFVDGRSQIAVTAQPGSLAATLGTSWTVGVTDPDGDTCGGYSARSTLTDVVIDQACIDADGGSTGWKVTVAFTFVGSAEGPYTATPVGGSPATYTAPMCDVTGLAAHWSGHSANPSVTIAGVTAAAVANCTGWSYVVVGPQTANCATDGNDPPPDVIALPASCSDTPSTGDWTVAVTYTGVDHSPHTATLPITGDPPQ